MREFNFSHKLIKLVEISIMETFIKIKMSSPTDPIQMKSNLKKRDSMSPLLFNIILEKNIKAMNV